ncbi:hypothetical protein AYI68_g3317 [Smittium mucronatum]|uniref:Uncharacterized protein n=1 Tax=Smittium mucronatum TaxID=133383 RepID=A0A1R0H086_9FUNG|nr:hypothetical protein AYI68_g3317 [Smittium mucronatum]
MLELWMLYSGIGMVRVVNNRRHIRTHGNNRTVLGKNPINNKVRIRARMPKKHQLRIPFLDRAHNDIDGKHNKKNIEHEKDYIEGVAVLVQEPVQPQQHVRAAGYRHHIVHARLFHHFGWIVL